MPACQHNSLGIAWRSLSLCFVFSFFLSFFLLPSLLLCLSLVVALILSLSFPGSGSLFSFSILSSHSLCFSLPTPHFHIISPKPLCYSCLSCHPLSLFLSLFKSSLILSSYIWTAVITFMTQILLLAAKYFVCALDYVDACSSRS